MAAISFVENPIAVSGVVLHALLVWAIVFIIRSSAAQIPLSKKAYHTALLVVILSGVLFYVSPQSASNLPIVPDSVEYAVGANRIVELGHYDIVVSGVSHPSRYPPGFSLIGIAPYLVIFGSDVGNGVWILWLSAILATTIAFMVGHRIGGITCGILSSTFTTLSLPRETVALILPHLPCAALALVMLLAYLQLTKEPEQKYAWWFAVGTVIAVAASFRPLSAFLIIPFLFSAFQKKARWQIVFALLPFGAWLVTGSIYNYLTFGSVFRSGYHYWSAVPYDYPSMTFHWKYLATNIQVLLGTHVVPFAALASSLFWFHPRQYTPTVDDQLAVAKLRSVFFFTAVAIGPLVVFHFLYFFPSRNFFLSFEVCTAIMLGIALTQVFKRLNLSRTSVQILVTILALCALGINLARKPSMPARRNAADVASEQLPHDAILISNLDPVYLDPLFIRGTSRQVIPVSRRVEYASKLVSPVRIENPMPFPNNWRDHRSLGLRNAGARDAVAIVALENPNFIEQQLASGVPVFFMTALADKKEREQMSELFSLGEVRFGLYQQIQPAG